MISPFTYNFFPYREDDYTMTFRYQMDDLSPLNISGEYQDVRMRIFRAGDEAWPWKEASLGNGLVEIDSDRLGLFLSEDDTTELLNTNYYYEFAVIMDGVRRTHLNGQIVIFDVHSKTARNRGDLLLTVDSGNPMLLLEVETVDSQAQPPPPPPQDFVTVLDGQFVANGEEFSFNGTNAYYLPVYQKINQQVVINAFDAFELAGVKVVRMWAFYDGYDVPGSQSSTDPTENVIQIAPEEYDQNALQDLDIVIALGKEHGMKFVLPFTNYWEELGGISQYNFWAGHGTDSWGPERMQLFMDGQQQQEWFRSYISMLLNRVNTQTGIAYKDEPAIMAWNIMNEARNPANGGTGTVLRDWYQEIAQFIKSIDPNHLVGTGEEGFDEGSPAVYNQAPYSNTYWMRAGVGTSYILNCAIPEIDYGHCHWYHSAFGFGFRSGPDDQVLQDILPAQTAYISDHHFVAQDQDKPLMIGEYGSPFFDPGGDNDVTQLVKNQVYVPLYKDVEQILQTGGALLWELVNGQPKQSEYGGNISFPLGRHDARLFAEYKNHSLNRNGTPAEAIPQVIDDTLTVSQVTQDSFRVDFQKATDADFPEGIYFRLYRSNENNIDSANDILSNGVLMAEDFNVDHFEMENVAQAQLYINVLAIDPAGNATAYESELITLTEDNDPPVVSNPGLFSGLITQSTIEVLFEKATDGVDPQSVLEYELYRSLSDNIQTLPDIVANGTLTDQGTDVDNLTASGLIADTPYYFNVRVLDSSGNPSAYTSFSAQTDAEPTGPPEIDTNNPMAADLVLYNQFYEGAGGLIHDISGSPNTHDGQTTNGQWDQVNGEMVWSAVNGDSQILIPNHPDLNFDPGQPFTIAFRGTWNSGNNAWNSLIDKGWVPGWVLQWPGWDVGSISVGIGNVEETFPTGIGGDINNLHTLIVSATSPDGIADIYADGNPIGTIDLSGQGSIPSSSLDIILGLGFDATSIAHFNKFAIWRRDLGAQEVSDWNADPDLMLA